MFKFQFFRNHLLFVDFVVFRIGNSKISKFTKFGINPWEIANVGSQMVVRDDMYENTRNNRFLGNGKSLGLRIATYHGEHIEEMLNFQ